MSLRSVLFWLAASGIVAACGTARLEPNSRGGPDRFTVSIGIDRMNDMGGKNSPAMKTVLDQHAKRYCDGPYMIQSVTNTAAEMMFTGRCGAKE